MCQILALTLFRDSEIKESNLHSSNEAIKVQMEAAAKTVRQLKAAQAHVKEVKNNAKLQKE